MEGTKYVFANGLIDSQPQGKVTDPLYQNGQ
jgi:hypothetical protein